MPVFSSLYGTRLDRELGSADSTQLFTTARRKSAINEAQEEFARLTNCLERKSSIAITAWTGEYDLNSSAVLPAQDFYEWAPRGVEFRYTDASSNVHVLHGDDLPRRDPNWLDRYEPGWDVSTWASTTVMQQVPSFWYERIDGGARYLGFTPLPSSGSSASMEAFITYQARPTAMTSDTNEPFMVNSSVRFDLRPYHQALVHYAAHQLEKLRRDDQASERQLQKFLGYVQQYLQAMRKKGGTSLTFARSYFLHRRATS
jgi:hypothetical protein